MLSLKARRQQAGISQIELSRRIGRSRNYIAKMESGAFSASANVVARIDEVLGVGQDAVKLQRTAEEKFWHELWMKRYC